MKTVMVLAMLFLLGAYAHANRLIVAINPQDCIACQAALSDTARLKASFQSITIVFPSRFQADSQEIIQKFPLLNNGLFHVAWDDHPLPIPVRESISMAYYTDNAGNVLKKEPLKLFSPGSMIGLAPAPDNHILFEDTIQTTNKLPASMSNFLLTGDRLFMVDNIRGDAIYLDWKAKEKTYRSIKADAFTANSYKLYYGDQAKAEMARNEAILQREQVGPLYKIAGISESKGVIYITFKYDFINGFLLEHFDVAYGIVGDRVIENFLIVNPEVSDAAKAIEQIAKREELTDSSQIGPEQARKLGPELDSLLKYYAALAPNAYHPTTYDIFRLNDSEFALPALMNANSFRFVGLYRLSGHELRPEGRMLHIEKGKIYQESANYHHFQTLCGRFPYLMHRISNVLYNVQKDTSFLLPLPLGKYDIGPEAMAKLQPKTELYIQDVMVLDSVATVLYVAGEGNTLSRLSYDLKAQKVVIDGPLMLNGHAFQTKGSGYHVAFCDAHSFFVADEIDGTLTRVFLN